MGVDSGAEPGAGVLDVCELEDSEGGGRGVAMAGSRDWLILNIGFGAC